VLIIVHDLDTGSFAMGIYEFTKDSNVRK
jgi:hypothetical protein